MKSFLREFEREVLLLLVMMIAITRSWIPPIWGFENMYGASHWALSYDFGLIRRGLVGTLFKFWMPLVTIEGVRLAALATYFTFLALLLLTFFVLLKSKERGGRLFRIILLFCACPVSLAMAVHDLGRFDLFLTILTFLALTLLTLERGIWLIPVVMAVAMFTHESFFILYSPTIIAAMLFAYVRNGNRKKILRALIGSVVVTAASFVVLYQFGNPALPYAQFSRLLQARAIFPLTELSMRECYFGITEHVALAASSFYDWGSIVNVCTALLILSPVIVVLLNLWGHALRNRGTHRAACLILFLATLSGLILFPIATDYGRWLSAIIYCNFFAVFFLMSKDIIRIEELSEYSEGLFTLLLLLVVPMYLLFGPFHDWNPYPYTNNIIYSMLSMVTALLFDIGFFLNTRLFRQSGR